MIRYLPHAEEAIIVRGIDRAWIEAAIATPDRTERDPRHPGRTRSYKATAAFGDRVLRVVHWQEGTDVMVLTVHFDRGATRRRQNR